MREEAKENLPKCTGCDSKRPSIGAMLLCLEAEIQRLRAVERR